MRKDTWNTYSTKGYTYDVAQDQASAGGVHLHQVRKKGSRWQRRILQSNGNHSASGPINSITDEEGLSLYEEAKQA